MLNVTSQLARLRAVLQTATLVESTSLAKALQWVGGRIFSQKNSEKPLTILLFYCNLLKLM